jgi:xyloglucan-specific exo-beta-1,4-glucanase
MQFFQTAAILASALYSACVDAAASQAFTWKNVRIGGGGGFVPGIIFNPSLKGLAYARCDIGGAYRLNSDDSWTPLLDSVNNSNWHNWGVDALATDPVDTNNLYLAVGLYTNSWDPNLGSILRSTDQGDTWEQTNLPFKVGGNMPGRGVGERLAVDPHSNNIIYFGARSGHGLWKSTDYGVTWNNVTAFIWTGTYIENSTSSYTSDPAGIAWVTFDTTTGTSGSATPRIFVGVVDVGHSVFKSEDAGVTWAWVSGEPQYGFLPHKGVLSPAEKSLYVTYANGEGPYDGTNGTVHKYNITSGVWTDISPTSLASTYYGYGGLSVDLQRPGTVMVAALNCWWPDEIMWRSIDGGTTWSPIWAWNGYPALDFYYSYDISEAPWLQDNTSTAQFLSRVGWMVESLSIDPFDSNHWLYGTGATIYGSHDLLNWDSEHNVTIKSLAYGIEETAAYKLLVVPGGPPLLSAVGDIGGFLHWDLDTAPAQAFHTPTYGSTHDLDYAGNAPANVVRTGESSTAIQVAVSGNYGLTWYAYYGASLSIGPGPVAFSANADTILLMSNTNGPLISKNTATFSAIPTLPSGAVIASDKRNGTVFYGGNAGSFYVSTDTGVTFSVTGTLGSSTVVNTVRVHPTVAGDVWASTDVGLFHSTNYGKTFTQISSGVTAGYSFALGAASTSTGYPVIYGFFEVDSVIALFKTEDAGLNWAMISDAAHGFAASSANVVGADMATYGRVFVGTNGRGIFYGAPSGTLPPVTVTATSTGSSSTSSSKATTSTSSKASTTTSSSSTKATTSSSSSVSTSSSSTKATTTSSSSKSTTATSTTSSSTATGTAAAYGQCGGLNYVGPVLCPTGYTCTVSSAYYSQCVAS